MPDCRRHRRETALLARRQLFVVVASLLLASACGPVVGPASIAESRVILEENFTWATPEGADRTLDRIQRAGFNVVVPCVWAGMGTGWPSKSERAHDPRIAKQLAAGKDPLAAFIKKAHARGIEVHPWFKISTRWRDFRKEFYDVGTPEIAFDVHKPEFRRYIVALMIEVVERYDIDGINLDYVRTKGNCTSDYCVRQYRQITGRDLLRDTAAATPRSTAWRQLTAWNSAAVDDIVRSVSERARAIRPDLLISADSHTGRDHWRIQGADSVSWANRGWVDVIYNMQYGSKIKQAEIDVAVAALVEPQRMVILNGNWTPPAKKGDPAGSQSGRFVADAIGASQRRFPGGNGVALYQYKYLTDEHVAALASGPFRLPAVPSWPAKRETPTRQ